MPTDPDAPLRMPVSGAARRHPAVDARRHLALSSWLTGVMAVALVAVALARPDPAPQIASAKPQPMQLVALR